MFSYKTFSTQGMVSNFDFSISTYRAYDLTTKNQQGLVLFSSVQGCQTQTIENRTIKKYWNLTEPNHETVET